MSFPSMRKFSGLTAVCAGLVLSVAACSDSTGPDNLSSKAALQSLSLGVVGLSTGASPAAGSLAASLDVITPFLDKVNVTVDGKSQTMFTLGLRESFPDGTCEESLFVPSFPSDPGTCTPPSLGVMLIFWQSHSPMAPPDRLIVIAADEGTSNFDFFSPDATVNPALAFYLEGPNPDNIMVSETGTLTSHVGTSGTSCNLPLPPYATTATCSFATFDEEGTISFASFDGGTISYDVAGAASGSSKVVTIPRQTLHGVWEAITQIKQIVPLAASRALTPSLLRRPAQAALLSAPGTSQK
jgi:hypothetical protein